MQPSFDIEFSENDGGLRMWYTTAAGELFFTLVAPADVFMVKEKMAAFISGRKPDKTDKVTKGDLT